MDVSIRFAKPDDTEKLCELVNELAIFEGEKDVVKVTPAVLRHQMESETPPFECLVAELEGRIVGFALFFQNYSTWEGCPGIYIDDVYVSPDMRGFGIGKLLFTCLANLAMERGYTRMDWIALKENEIAVRFYERIKAKRLSDWDHWRFNADDIARMAATKNQLSAPQNIALLSG